jgi:hypothetical protein
MNEYGDAHYARGTMPAVIIGNIILAKTVSKGIELRSAARRLESMASTSAVARSLGGFVVAADRGSV